MFPNLPKWTNRKLRRWIVIANILVIGLSYLAPLITILCMCWNGGDSDGGGKWKLPITALVIFCAFVFAMSHFFNKSISKMSIYDNKNQTLKHILEAVSRLIVPVTIIVISSLFATWMKARLDFYVEMIIVCLCFYVSGALVDRLVLGFLDDERFIREEAKKANAVSDRQTIVKGK